MVVKTKEADNYPQRLHALDIATGAEKFGGPVVHAGDAFRAAVVAPGGRLPFDSLRQNQRPALLLSNGVVYFGFGSHGDVQPYQGWLLGYNATTLQRVIVFNHDPKRRRWWDLAGDGGLAVDAAGNIYFVTGNGT